MNRSSENFVFKGLREFLKDADTPVDSPAARDLIAREKLLDDNDPLYLVAIGAITNVASAILMEPQITKKIVVIWLGGNPISYPHTTEFNLSQDAHAARVVLDCSVPVIPCMGVASHLLSTVQELESCIGGKNAICDALVELYSANKKDHFGWANEIWDVSAIGLLINPAWMPTMLIHSPLLTDDSHWAHDERCHLISQAYFFYRNPIFKDMFKKLS